MTQTSTECGNAAFLLPCTANEDGCCTCVSIYRIHVISPYPSIFIVSSRYLGFSHIKECHLPVRRRPRVILLPKLPCPKSAQSADLLGPELRQLPRPKSEPPPPLPTPPRGREKKATTPHRFKKAPQSKSRSTTRLLLHLSTTRFSEMNPANRSGRFHEVVVIVRRREEKPSSTILTHLLSANATYLPLPKIYADWSTRNWAVLEWYLGHT